ncbi:hypothetical protein LB518_22820 [Mesorhizobium sp. BR1-1-16]|uniref:hypothetical protein n=1 Tax=Mesorhizobium sp. BR1-1-16 TaxID=2876653 RepID=UPI001CCCC799|nr:hypothetical protein [Mesorhizobium sp. BR1-1-16]MBZ9939148.1 hypothetical protein [Mesorhizobium sp. BR1-1-16]
MRRTEEIEDLIDDLNELALASAGAMNDGISIGGMDRHFLSRIAGIGIATAAETTEAEAAEIIRCYFDALVRIADGTSEASAIAEAALSFEPTAATTVNGQPLKSAD